MKSSIMTLKSNKFEKMIRGDLVSEQVSNKKEMIDVIRLNELEDLKQRIFVNSLSHINDDVIRGKCLDIITHYRLFKNDESFYKVKELSDDEKKKLDKCIGVCIQKECAGIIKERESIPSGMLITKINYWIYLIYKYLFIY